MDPMKKATSLAYKADSIGEVPIGAVIVKGDKIISSGYNSREKDQIATHHAEIIAIEKACKKLNDFRLLGCDIYVTLEPCVMCMGAILNSRISCLYFGAYISNGSISAKELCERANLNHKTTIEGGFLLQECSNLISDYFREKRKK